MYTQEDIKRASEANYRRTQIIADNRSRRMRGMEPHAVPAKIVLTGFEVYIGGDYSCFIPTDDESEALQEVNEAQAAGQVEAGQIKLKKTKLNGF